MSPSAAKLEALRSVTVPILNPQEQLHLLRPRVIELSQLLEEAGTFRIDPSADIGDGEIQTSNGMAVSPTMAAMCMIDFARTIQFIRGLHAAIADVRRRIPGRPARVLYVGCGPYATLAVPQMAVFSPEHVNFTLLDINPASIESAASIVDQLGLRDFITANETMDAASYRIDPEQRPDLIVMEIMAACLSSEPQVAISRALLAQAPEAILIPEEVRIDLLLVNSSREFNSIPPAGDRSEIQRDRIPVGSVFVLNRETIDSWKDIRDLRLPGAMLHIPDFTEQRYAPRFFTTIRVFLEHILKDYQSGLTAPRKVKVDGGIKAGDTIQFHYELGANPRLEGVVCPPAGTSRLHLPGEVGLG